MKSHPQPPREHHPVQPLPGSHLPSYSVTPSVLTPRMSRTSSSSSVVSPAERAAPFGSHYHNHNNNNNNNSNKPYKVSVHTPGEEDNNSPVCESVSITPHPPVHPDFHHPHHHPAVDSTTTATGVGPSSSSALSGLPHGFVESDFDYIQAHRLPDVMEHLAFALLESKPDDHVAFARRWLANLRTKMDNQNVATAHGLNLYSIDGNRLQRLTSILDPKSRDAEQHRLGQRSGGATTTGMGSGSHSTGGGGSSNQLGSSASRNRRKVSKGVEIIRKLAEKLHKEDFAPAIAYLQSLIARQDKKQNENADADMMMGPQTKLHKFHHLGESISSPGFGSGAAADEAAGGHPPEERGPGDNHHHHAEGAVTGNDPTSTTSSPIITLPPPASAVSNNNAAQDIGGHKRRRIAISATPLAIERLTNFEVQTVEKAPEERVKLVQCVAQCSLFAAFDDATKELVVNAMTKQDFPAGTNILTQGEPGRETFYLVVHGVAEVIKDRKVIAPIDVGQYFGELELMYNEPSCAATIKAITALSTYSLGKETYQHIVLNATLERRALFMKQINKVGIFETLGDYDRMRLAEALTTQNCSEGEYLIRCGEPVNWMYVVMSGETRVVGRTPEGKLINIIDLGEGHVLGELEFIFHHNAVADVVVLSDNTRVAKLNRHHFEMIIGNMTDEMKHYIATKEMYAHYLAHAEDKVKKDIEVVQRLRNKRHGAHNMSNPHGGDGGGGGGGSGPFGKGSSSHALGGGGGGAAAWHVEPMGEVLFAGPSKTVTRFPFASLIPTTKMVAILILEDGTVQHWSEGVAKATQYSPDQAVGQSLFTFLTSEEQQASFHSMLRQARHWTGNWDGFVEAGLFKPRTFDFLHGDGVCKVQLSLAVIPGLNVNQQHVVDTYLVVGTEIKRRIPAHQVDYGNWLTEKLKPKLDALMKLLDDKSSLAVPQTVRRARNNIASCDRVLTQFVRLASANLEAIQEAWTPVSIQVLFQRCLTNTSPALRLRNNRLTIQIDEDVPTANVFLDIESTARIITALIEDANVSNNNGEIVLKAEKTTATFAEPDMLSRTMSAQAMTRSVADFSPEATMSAGANNNTSGTDDRLQRLLITVYDNGTTAEDYQIRSVCSNDDDLEQSAFGGGRGSCLPEIRFAVEKMGGVFNTVGAPDIEGTEHQIEIPLVVDTSSDDKKDGELSDGRTFTTVLVETSSVLRNNICQLLWSRRHAVLPVTTWREVQQLVESRTCDILLLDPECLTNDELFNKVDPFDILRNNRIAVIVSSSSITSATVTTAETTELTNADVVTPLQLPKPSSAGLLHLAFQRAEGIVRMIRDEEERITALRNTFSETKHGAYSIGKLLGKGAFGEVYEVLDDLTGGKMAMKTMRLQNRDMADTTVEEIRTMTQLQHENIIHYFYCEKSGDNELKIFMELAAGGTLQDKIRNVPGQCGLSLIEIVRHLTDLLAGMSYIHAHRYVHCDIKTANALLDTKGRTKLGDFGTARKLKENEKVYHMSGTPIYMAPEVMAADETEGTGYDMKADIWSLGCVVLEMATGQPPFSHIEGTQGMGIFRFIGELTEAPDLSPLFHAPPLLFQFVKACLEPDPAKRPTAAQLQKFPLLAEGGVDHSVQAEKLVKRAQLLHTLSNFVAFVDPDEPVGGKPGGAKKSFFRSRQTSRGRENSENTSMMQEGNESMMSSWGADSDDETDARISYMVDQGDFFDSDDDDEDDDGGNNNDNEEGEGSSPLDPSTEKQPQPRKGADIDSEESSNHSRLNPLLRQTHAQEEGEGGAASEKKQGDVARADDNNSHIIGSMLTGEGFAIPTGHPDPYDIQSDDD